MDLGGTLTLTDSENFCNTPAVKLDIFEAEMFGDSSFMGYDKWNKFIKESNKN